MINEREGFGERVSSGGPEEYELLPKMVVVNIPARMKLCGQRENEISGG
jgi:hypothetical protein